MQTNSKDQTEGTLSKLRDSFREIFGKTSDAPKLKAADARNKLFDNDRCKKSSDREPEIISYLTKGERP